MEKERLEGYYWVKHEGNWKVAYWYSPFTDGSKKEWDLFDRILSDTDFEEIDENRIVRQPVYAD